MNDEALRLELVGNLRVALATGESLIGTVASVARLDPLAARGATLARLSDDDLWLLLKEALQGLDPPAAEAGEDETDLAPHVIEKTRQMARSTVLANNLKHGVPLRLRWGLGCLLTRAAEDSARDPGLRHVAALARRALVLCELAETGGPPGHAAKSARATPLRLDGLEVDPVRIDVMPAHELADALAALIGGAQAPVDAAAFHRSLLQLDADGLDEPLSQEQAAKFLNVTPRALREYHKQPGFPTPPREGREKVYGALALVRWAEQAGKRCAADRLPEDVRLRLFARLTEARRPTVDDAHAIETGLWKKRGVRHIGG